MTSRLKKIIIPAFFIVVANSVHAQSVINQDAAQQIVDQTDIVGGRAGFNNTLKVGTVLSTVVTVFLSMMGIVFLVLMLLAGYRWMTASGDEKKVTDAKDTIMRAVIGLIIIVTAYAITAFVFKSVDTLNP